jgi:hypothetical protein
MRRWPSGAEHPFWISLACRAAPLAGLSGKGGLPCIAAAEDHHAPHPHMMLDVRATPAAELEMDNASWASAVLGVSP